MRNQVFKVMKFTKNDEAVSPVIGVILMVAITVILAAVIAAFVFGMAGNIGTSKQVAATATSNTNAAGAKIITVTFQGGKDSGSVLQWGVNATDPAGAAITTMTQPDTNTVGTMVSFTGTTGDKDHVTATAMFTDGSSQVVLDTYV